MAKLCPRRVAPKRTLRQLAHIKLVAPRCPKCDERIYKVGCKMHKCKREQNVQ